MTDGDALLAAIRVHPDEDVPRLAYADWLDENGQPERAAFIRVQVELARKENRTRLSPECVCDMLAIGEPCCVACQRREDEVEALKARERELLDVTNGKRWFPEFSFVACGDLSRYTGTHLLGTARRGFVESVAGPWADWVIEADEALERYPIQSVSLTTMPPYEWQLANWNPVEAARSRRGAGRRLIARDALECRWPSVKTWHLPPEPLEAWPVMSPQFARMIGVDASPGYRQYIRETNEEILRGLGVPPEYITGR